MDRRGGPRGGIKTLSLHLDNPVSGRNAWDNRPTVEHVLPGGLAHKVFLETLDDVAKFLGALKRKNGKLIPVILRPFHEHNQTWPWWDAGLAAKGISSLSGE